MSVTYLKNNGSPKINISNCNSASFLLMRNPNLGGLSLAGSVGFGFIAPSNLNLTLRITSALSSLSEASSFDQKKMTESDL